MRSPAPSCPAKGEEQFLRDIRNELHALAQPLTLLQIRLEAARLCGEDASTAQSLLPALEGDVKRACAHFSTLQGLARERSVALRARGRCSGQDLLHSVHDALTFGARGHGLHLQEAGPMQPIWVLANEHDLRCALLQAALLIGSALSTFQCLTLSLHAVEDTALIHLTVPDLPDLNEGTSSPVAEVLLDSLAKLGFAVALDPCLQATLHLPLAPGPGVGVAQ